MNPYRTKRAVEGHVPDQANVSSLGVRVVPLEFRLRQLRHRRRRAILRQLVIGACWSLGLVGVAAFAIALSMTVVHP